MSVAVRDEAQAVLDRCDADTPRDLIVWAAGAVVCDRAFYFATFPILSGMLPGWGRPSHNGRMFDCSRRGVHICANTSYRPEIVAPVRWSEIADLATLDRIGLPLHRRILDAVAERDGWLKLPAEGRRSWNQVMNESQALARLVWQRCRPGVSMQLDLLDLIGAAP